MFQLDTQIESAAAAAMKACTEAFARIEENTEYNQQKMLRSFIDNGVSESHFAGTTGYGYDDRGRDTLDRVFAEAVGAEDALVRHNFVSGTHAITVALFGLLRPGDTMLCVTGTPYDTLHGVIGLKPASGSLREFGIKYDQIELTLEGHVDYAAMEQYLSGNSVRMVYAQRSRGYNTRPSLFVSELGRIAEIVKRVSPGTLFVVDNCYGEFVEKSEPTAAGADIIIGSLIKNPGGGIAPTGGYIAGKHEYVEQCAYRLTTPATGREVGCTLGHNRELYMGIFSAPVVTGEALKTATFAAALFEQFGFSVSPNYREPRADIIQTVTLGNEEALIAFCQGMQKGAPVDSFVSPEPWDMPGYDSQIIMAAGAFTLGASVELSADAPLRPPYAAWMQGGVNFYSAKMGVLLAAQSMLEKGFLCV